MTGEAMRIVIALLAGGAIGSANLAALRATTRLYLAGRGAALPAGLHLARLAVLAAVLVGAARLGGDVLLAAAAGFVLARPLAMRALGRTP